MQSSWETVGYESGSPCNHRSLFRDTVYASEITLLAAIPGEGELEDRAAETTATGAENAINGVRLNQQLSAQSAFNASGGLSQEAIAGAREIIPSAELGNPAIPSGFSKFSTGTFDSPSTVRFKCTFTRIQQLVKSGTAWITNLFLTTLLATNMKVRCIRLLDSMGKRVGKVCLVNDWNDLPCAGTVPGPKHVAFAPSR